MKTPRNISADELTRLLYRHYGYAFVRQRGSHIRIETTRNGLHAITIPEHSPISIGTLAKILGDVAEHFGVSRDEVMRELFD
ncbi:MAG TPA: type II toxin-antitoxin system HicA family toxin [Thermoflexales bacterium]|nr:type II toxin-antitoxin system HicA family toxin [Thermoflexales bacterium]HQW34864.1 type II toxin-antitoxin system HicA family toxin [Thermoflexales bacterium]HRA01499.1 type II toxin-antitoxin system HicA family toxin [Thermoflexales bacterium]